MLEIEQKLHQLHAEARAQAGSSHTHKDSDSAGAEQEGRLTARGVAKVNSVAEGSPAATAVS